MACPGSLPCYASPVKLSVKSDYAMRAVLDLARAHPSGEVQRVEDIAGRHGIPANYLVQILLELKARGLVRSVRGKEGGYRLAKPPAEITFGDVLRGITATKGSPRSRAKYASLTAVEPLDASTTVDCSCSQPLHSA